MRLGPLMRAAIVALALTAGGCSHLHWPWHRAAPAPPAPVHELDISGAAPDTYPQYWQRNTLLIDLSAARGAGSITLAPVSGTSWPMRVALRVTPGGIRVLKVRGAQRVVLPILQQTAHTIDLELDPGVYTAATPQVTVDWDQ